MGELDRPGKPTPVQANRTVDAAVLEAMRNLAAQAAPPDPSAPPQPTIIYINNAPAGAPPAPPAPPAAPGPQVHYHATFHNASRGQRRHPPSTLALVAVVLGLVACLIGWIPLHLIGRGAVTLGVVGLALGALGFLAALLRRRGVALPVAAMMVCLAGIAVPLHQHRELRQEAEQYRAKLHLPELPQLPSLDSVSNPQTGPDRPTPPGPQSAPPAPQVAPPVPATPQVAAPSSEPPSLTSSPVEAPRAPVLPPPPVAVPPAPQGDAPQTPAGRLQAAREQLAAAERAAEAALGGNAAYQKALSDAQSAERAVQAARLEYPAGSPQMQEASHRWMQARARLQQTRDEATGGDPAVAAARRALALAEAMSPSTTRLGGKDLP